MNPFAAQSVRDLWRRCAESLLHLVQEYARHAGHLDIWRELHDGTVGEIGPDASHGSEREPQPPPGLP